MIIRDQRPTCNVSAVNRVERRQAPRRRGLPKSAHHKSHRTMRPLVCRCSRCGRGTSASETSAVSMRPRPTQTGYAFGGGGG